MADTIVVLDSSDDDDDRFQRSREAATQNIRSTLSENRARQNVSPHGNAPAKAKKRKMHHSTEEENTELANCKRLHTTYPEESPTIEKRPVSTPLIPLITSVETVATPTATPPLQLLASPPRNANGSRESLLNSPIIPNLTPLNSNAVNLNADALTKSAEKAVRRVKPTTLLKESDEAWQQVRQQRQLRESLESTSSPKPATPKPSDNQKIEGIAPPVMDLTKSPNQEVNDIKSHDSPAAEVNEERPPLEKEYEELINVCRKAETSSDMEKLIETKLIKYYYSVPSDFVKSRGFRKNVCGTTERIRAEPELVYLHLKTVVDELNVRRKAKHVVVNNEETAAGSSSAGTSKDGKHNEQIKKLNKAMYILTKRIERLEEAEVDWDEEDSSYLQVERFKKRACQIYEKICDLTGESKHAHRLVKKPIQFSGTAYPAFNKTLQAYINRTKEFPDFFDVMRTLEHCNRQYDFKLANFEMKRIAQDAFVAVGKILQSRRKTDLYEMVTHFTAQTQDPAKSDPTLLAKLNQNQKTQTKINDIIAKYAQVQDDPEAAEELRKLEERNQAEKYKGKAQHGGLPSDDSDDNDDDDEEENENIETHVDKLMQDNTVYISDAESDGEIKEDSGGGGKDSSENKPLIKANSDSGPQSVTNKEKILIEEKAKLDLHLTENNNIMRTKTCDSNEHAIVAATPPPLHPLHIENSNGPAKMTTNIPSMKSTIDIVLENSKMQEKAAETDNGLLVELVAQPKSVTATVAATSKIAPIATSKQRTIAEIVISDEE